MTPKAKRHLRGFGSRLIVSLILASYIFIGGLGIKTIVDSFTEPALFGKDLVSVYSMTKAALNGVNPYLPLPDLAARWICNGALIKLDHPTPHPPFVAFLFLPLGFVSFKAAAYIWLLFELIMLWGLIDLTIKEAAPGASRLVKICAYFAALLWVPTIKDLWFGQYSILLSYLTFRMWLLLRDEKFTGAGAILGAMIAIKLAAWPIALYLLIRRKWSAVFSAGGVIAFAHSLAIYQFGYRTVLDYYQKVGPTVALLYRKDESNYSFWTLGARLFDDFGREFTISPLLKAPALAGLLAPLLPTLLLSYGMYLAIKAKQFDTSFGILILVGILVNPIAWSHYLILTVLPFLILFKRMRDCSSRRSRRSALFGIVVALSLPPGFRIAAVQLFSEGFTASGKPLVPWWAALLTVLPAIALLGLLHFLWKSDGVANESVLERGKANSLYDSIAAAAN